MLGKCLQRLNDRLHDCQRKSLLQSKFTAVQRLHRRNAQERVKPFCLPTVFQVQGRNMLCLQYMVNNLLQMDGVIDQTCLNLIAKVLALEQMINSGDQSDNNERLLELINSYKQHDGNFNYTVAHRAFKSLGYTTEYFDISQLELVKIFLKDKNFKGFTVHTGGENSGHFYALVSASNRIWKLDSLNRKAVPEMLTNTSLYEILSCANIYTV